MVWKLGGNTQIVRAYVPLAEMFGYAKTVLRSATQGRGTFMMVFDHYEDVPKSVQDEIIKKKRRQCIIANPGGFSCLFHFFIKIFINSLQDRGGKYLQFSSNSYIIITLKTFL